MSDSKWTFAHNFCADFQSKAADITSRLDQLKYSTAVTPDRVQAVAVDLSRLAKDLSEATGSLPSYDQRQCETQLKSLERATEELRRASSATPKFSFKRAAKSKPAEPSSTAVIAQNSPPAVGSANAFASLSCRYLSISDLEARHQSGEITLAGLSNCVVNLLRNDDRMTPVSAIHAQRVTNCVILLPYVDGSILIHDMSNSVLVAGCHQFRMHTSSKVDVYLSAGSNPVIERCSDIRFAGYPSALSQYLRHEDKEPLAVQDFSHIRPTPSPNWCILPEEQRERSWPLLALEGQALLDDLNRILPGDRHGGISEN